VALSGRRVVGHSCTVIGR